MFHFLPCRRFEHGKVQQLKNWWILQKLPSMLKKQIFVNSQKSSIIFPKYGGTREKYVSNIPCFKPFANAVKPIFVSRKKYLTIAPSHPGCLCWRIALSCHLPVKSFKPCDRPTPRKWIHSADSHRAMWAGRSSCSYLFSEIWDDPYDSDPKFQKWSHGWYNLNQSIGEYVQRLWNATSGLYSKSPIPIMVLEKKEKWPQFLSTSPREVQWDSQDSSIFCRISLSFFFQRGANGWRKHNHGSRFHSLHGMLQLGDITRLTVLNGARFGSPLSRLWTCLHVVKKPSVMCLF